MPGSKLKFNKDIHVTDTKGNDVSMYYRLVSKHWIWAVTAMVSVILLAVIFLSWSVSINYRLLIESRARGVANRKMIIVKDQAIRSAWDEIQILRKSQGLPREDYPALYPPEPFAWINDKGEPIIFDPATGTDTPLSEKK